MEEYHKIQTLFKRDLQAPKKPMIEGDWTTPELKYLASSEWEFTEKVDGTNIRIGYGDFRKSSAFAGPQVVFGGRTDNAMIPVKLLNYMTEKFTSSLFEDNNLREIVLYGEGYGPGIQSGGLYRADQSFVLFDVVIRSDGQNWWLTRDNVEDIANKLDIDYVPQIGVGTLHDAIHMVKTGLNSEWGNFEAEGIVARPMVPLFNRKGERIICKIKGKDFR
jgi:hypothetical protein